MSISSRNKEIKVQRDAQSLDHFKNKVAGSEDAYVSLLKPVLAGAGALVLALLAWVGWSSLRARAVERHEVALAELLRSVEGSGATPPSSAEVEKRMREKRPALEELVRSAPASERAAAEGLLASWNVVLGQAGPAPAAEPRGPWQRLRQAHRFIALGKAEEAARVLAPLRKDATPQEPWGKAYWAAVLDCDRLQGDRGQALKNLAEFKARYKSLPDENALDVVMKGI